MKEVKQYICECCGVLYADKVKAQECERNHKSAISILYQRFLPKRTMQAAIQLASR